MKIIILGGGCFGSQYARSLLIARKRGKIDFKELIVVDQDKNCWVKKDINDPDIKIEISDWIDFLVDYIRHTGTNTRDHIVPSHAAPHLLGKAFKMLIERHCEEHKRRSNLEMFDIPSPIGTPYEKELEKGVVAVSVARWICPANCTEPEICPYTHARRHWDLGNLLKKWARSNRLSTFYVFPARHYAFSVSTIPAKAVINAWRLLKKKIQKKNDYHIGIATSSACHGIISLFDVRIS